MPKLIINKRRDGLQFLLKCNYNADCINKNLPTFYWELLQYFQEFKNKTKIFPYGNFLLWNNEAITIEKKMLFWKSWFNKKIFFIQDILNADANFLTFREFQNKFSIKTNLHCPQSFYSEELICFNYVNTTDISLSNKQITFNTCSSAIN